MATTATGRSLQDKAGNLGRRRTVKRFRPGQRTGLYRAYTFKCVCGLQVKGFYQVQDLDAPLDKKRAVCRMTRGQPSYPSTSRASRNTRMERVVIGCGKTLEEIDQINEQKRLDARIANNSIGNHPLRKPRSRKKVVDASA